METQEELMKRILTADAEQYREPTLLLKEDGATPLKIEAAQDYINELEAQVKLLGRSKANLAEQVNRYDGDMGVYLHFKEILITLLQHYDVMDIIKDEVLDGLPDLDGLEERLADVEYENENKPDDYEVVDNVVDSVTFESRVEDIITDKLNEVKFKLTIEEE
jgi:hypothetical protein